MRRATGSHSCSSSPSTTSPIKLPPPATPIHHRIWSSHAAFRRLPSHSVPRVPEDAGERQGKIVSWLPARGKRRKVLKYLTGKRSRWNEEVLFCFIFDAGKLRRYTGLPFKSQRCHSQWEFSVTPRMTLSRLFQLGAMFTWYLLIRESSNLWRNVLFNSKDLSFFNY